MILKVANNYDDCSSSWIAFKMTMVPGILVAVTKVAGAAGHFAQGQWRTGLVQLHNGFSRLETLPKINGIEGLRRIRPYSCTRYLHEPVSLLDFVEATERIGNGREKCNHRLLVHAI